MALDAKLIYTADEVFCPVRATLALLGQKWVPHIVYELLAGKRRFNELSSVVGGCNSRTLRDRLRELEELEVVSRRLIAGNSWPLSRVERRARAGAAMPA